MRAANERTGRAVGFGGHTARVHDDDIGSERLVFCKRTQMSGDGLAVRARCAASEVFDDKSRHRLSLLNIRRRSDWPGACPAV